MAKYINPFTDWGFKRLFGQEFSKDLLISFLNDLLEGELHVADVTFKDKEQVPRTNDQRGMIYDVYCKTDSGKLFILEMQNRWVPNFVDRTICYASRCVVGQADKSKTEKQNAYKILPVYVVSFMNYKPHDEEVVKFRTDVVMADKETGETVSDKLRFIYLSLPLFKKKAEECVTDFEKWIYVLKHMEALERMPFTAQKAIFKELADYVDSHRLTKKEREKYENSLWILRDNIACMAAAEQEAIERGLAKGLEQGLEQGMEKGLEKGKLQKALSIAGKLLAMGMSDSQVMEATGLTEAQIDDLKSH